MNKETYSLRSYSTDEIQSDIVWQHNDLTFCQEDEYLLKKTTKQQLQQHHQSDFTHEARLDVRAVVE